MPHTNLIQNIFLLLKSNLDRYVSQVQKYVLNIKLIILIIFYDMISVVLFNPLSRRQQDIVVEKELLSLWLLYFRQVVTMIS